MGRSSGLGNIIDSVAGGGTLRGKGRVSGIPMPFTPTENIGMMSGPIRKKGERKRDKRGTRRGIAGLPTQVTMQDAKTGRMYGGMVKDGVPLFKKPDFVSDEDFKKSFPKLDSRVVDKIPGLTPMTPKPRFDPNKPSAVQETTRVNVQDPTLGGPPEREVPLPKEKDMTPRGPAPFAPDEERAAKQRFFETMFERAANRRERKEIESAENRDIRRVSGIEDRERGGRRRGRRDFTRRRPERRRSREERAQFRDRYVSTLGGNFFS